MVFEANSGNAETRKIHCLAATLGILRTYFHLFVQSPPNSAILWYTPDRLACACCSVKPRMKKNGGEPHQKIPFSMEFSRKRIDVLSNPAKAIQI